MESMSKLLHTHRHILVGVLLAIITLAAFWRVLDCDFVDYDDNRYVILNSRIQTGFTWEAVKWAFTAGYEATWQPLIWLSYMLDHQLYGLKPYGYHLTNLLLHIANTLLLFLVLGRMTKSLWRSAFVAALFAIHPLHVESVAWVAERKDVLSGLFWMLAMWAYVSYASRGGAWRYVLVMLALGLGLMSKPMLVTLPFALLLLDYWPLRRFTPGTGKAGPGWKLVWEKAPLFALAAASSVITFVVQQERGALSSLRQVPLGVRAANSFLAYAQYIRKMLWPSDLAVIYPHSMSGPPVLRAIGAALLLVFLSILVIRAWRQRPYLAVGWLWYLGTLVPMIGIVQTGAHALADRFTYIPLIGIFIMIAWGVPDLLARVRVGERVLPVLACAVTAALMVCTWIQVGYWHNSVTLFQHALRVTTGNYVAHNCLGEALGLQGKTDQALNHLYKALAIEPNYSPVHANLGIILCEHGRLDEGAAQLREAVRLDPRDPVAHCDLGVALSRQGRFKEAITHLSKALEIDPGLDVARCNLEALSREAQKREPVAAGGFELLEAKREHAMTYYNAGIALDERHKTDEAIREYREAIRINPDLAQAHNNLGFALRNQGKDDEAIREFQEAVRLKPDLRNAHNNLAISLYLKGRYAKAWKEVELCRKYGLNPHPDFVKALSQKMPEPAH